MQEASGGDMVEEGSRSMMLRQRRADTGQGRRTQPEVAMRVRRMRRARPADPPRIRRGRATP